MYSYIVSIVILVGAHGGRSGHLVLILVALSFSKLQTFLNNIPEGNPLKSVYLTPKIAFTFRHICGLLTAALHILLFPHFHNKGITTNLSVVSYNQK